MEEQDWVEVKLSPLSSIKDGYPTYGQLQGQIQEICLKGAKLNRVLQKKIQ